MSDHVSIERMHEAVDGALTSAEMTTLELHIDSCALCRNEYARLSEVVRAVRALPRAGEAPTGTWAGIAARIEADVHEADVNDAKVLSLPVGRAPRAGHPVTSGTPASAASVRRIAFSIPQLATAAAVIALVSAVTVFMALGARDTTTVAADSSFGESMSESFDRPGGAAARAVSQGGGPYVEVVLRLEQILDAGRGVLAPETLGTIEASLRSVDDAISEIETALGHDPNSDLLLRLLANHQRTKLGVLQRAAAAVQAQT